MVGPSDTNAITVNRYHVDFVRSDGRNTQGVDVPYSFDGAVTGTVGAVDTSLSFVLVRAQAKLEAPLMALRNAGGAMVISTIARSRSTGRTRPGTRCRSPRASASTSRIGATPPDASAAGGGSNLVDRARAHGAEHMVRAFRALALLLTVAVAAGCSVEDQTAPPLSGPSELALSLTVGASPDILAQDGASQSQVIVVARDAAGQAAVQRHAPPRNHPGRANRGLRDAVVEDRRHRE